MVECVSPKHKWQSDDYFQSIFPGAVQWTVYIPLKIIFSHMQWWNKKQILSTESGVTDQWL